MQVGELIAAALTTENSNTECTDGGKHVWEAHPAKGKKRTSQKIQEAADSDRKGMQFEAKAAKHNKNSGDLKRSEQLSGSGDEQIKWICSVCGFDREGDQLHDDDTKEGAPVAVEVKNKNRLENRDARQLGRNIQAVKQGGASGLIYKIPARSASDYVKGQLKAIGEHLGCAIKIIRI